MSWRTWNSNNRQAHIDFSYNARYALSRVEIRSPVLCVHTALQWQNQIERILDLEAFVICRVGREEDYQHSNDAFFRPPHWLGCIKQTWCVQNTEAWYR
jgi:hypothetical protein